MKITRRTEQEINISELKAAIKEGRGLEVIRPHDEITLALDTGETITPVCGYVGKHSARFVFKDCLREMWQMNKTIASCEISGSSDSSIREAVPTDLTPILQNAPIRQIFCNGTASYQLYCRHQQMRTGRTAVKLPSTSPANAAWSVERLTQAWMVILDALK